MKSFLFLIMCVCCSTYMLQAQTNIAIFSDLPNGVIQCVEIDDTYVYIGGFFTQCGAHTRNSIARYNKTTGALDVTWNPNANDGVGGAASVNVIRVVNGAVYVGGWFSNIGGQVRNRIAKLNMTNGNADATFNPNALGGNVNDILYVNGSLYVGGGFSNIDGQARSGLAKLDTTNGTVNATFNVLILGGIHSLLHAQGSLYVGGNFIQIGGQLRSGVAKLDTTNGTVDATFSANTGGGTDVYDVTLVNGSLYIGGNFTTVGATVRNYIAKVDATNGTLDGTFNPNAGANVYDIEYVDGVLYVGGNFSSIGGEARNRIAKLDTTTGAAASDFTINLNNHTGGIGGEAIRADNGRLYVGGYFTSPVNYLFVTTIGTALTTIPTVGEWAMIVLSLSLFCVAVMYVRKPAFGGVGQMRDLPVQSMFLRKEDFVFRAKWFFPLSFVVTAVVWSACVYFHETAVRDMVGTALTGLIGSYLLQLLVLWYRDSCK